MKITMETKISIAEYFNDFIIAKKAQGLADKTLKSYKQQFKSLSRHLDVTIPIDELTKADLNRMVTSMRNTNLATNSISSYIRVFKVFLSWCNEEGITNLNMKPYKTEETIKETYSDSELQKLLKKPNLRKCNFAEYRSWVIVNLLLNNGCRAATIRNIQNQDVDLDNQVIYLRHTKNKKAQVIPLCRELCSIIREYMRVRGGEDSAYLFPNESGEQLKEYALRSSIARYNNRRGVQKTSIHSFRHTFARKYLVDCGGNAFTLQRLLGHSTLDMTKHYCAIFDADIVKNYDNFSPLAQLKSNANKIKMDRNKTR
jgi:integrase/recombinase XerD